MAEELPPFQWDHVWPGCCHSPEMCGTSTKIRFVYGCYPYTASQRRGYLAAIENALLGWEAEAPLSDTTPSDAPTSPANDPFGSERSVSDGHSG